MDEVDAKINAEGKLLVDGKFESEDILNFRMKKIMDIKNYIEFNIDNRKRLKKMYSKAISVIHISDMIAASTTLGISAAGVGLLSTIVAAPIVLVLESIALGTGFLSFILKYINKKLLLKLQKHQKILVLAESKLNSLYDLISKAISDGIISEEEFKLILDEEEKFRNMKEQIRKDFELDKDDIQHKFIAKKKMS